MVAGKGCKTLACASEIKLLLKAALHIKVRWFNLVAVSVVVACKNDTSSTLPAALLTLSWQQEQSWCRKIL
jgi:hypothetical protein